MSVPGCRSIRREHRTDPPDARATLAATARFSQRLLRGLRVAFAFGKIVAAGPGGNRFALARYGSGTLDTTFSGNGKHTTTIGAASWASSVAVQSDGKVVAAGTASWASSVAVQSDGKVVAAGTSIGSFSGGRERFALARHLTA